MKIVSRSCSAIRFTASVLALLVSVSGYNAAQAADQVSAPSAPNAMALGMPGAIPHAPMAMPSAPPMVAPLPTSVTASAPVMNAAMNMSSGSSDSTMKSLAPLEEKVTDQAKSVVKQLGNVDGVNMDDLNTARLAVVKLDILIDIEKHLAELDKLKNKGKDKSLASAIPASALGVPSQFAMSKPVSSDVAFSAPSPRSKGVSEITGAEGKYAAVVQGKTVRVGDTLPDGSKVIDITAQHVTTKTKHGTPKELKVNGVDQVFGHVL